MNLLLINSIYLVFSSVEILVQTKLYYQFFSLCLERNVSQTSTVATEKNFFPSLYVISKACFDECFFIPCDNLMTLFFIQIYLYPERFYNRHDVTLFETSVLKEVRIVCPLSPQ